MGASPSEAIVPLHIDVHSLSGAVERRPRTVSEAWDDVYREAGYESGHSYSGGFGSKDGYTLIGKADVDTDLLEIAGRLVGRLSNAELPDVLAVPKDTDCPGPGRPQWCQQGKVRVTEKVARANGEEVVAEFQITCPVCDGTSRVPLPDDQRIAAEAKIADYRKAIAAFGPTVLTRAGVVYDDKWAPAAALQGRDHVWFGGYCSS